ncbi:TetR/AcrR family transcriptional regulator [Nocardia jejuensis]|uniref:TetR/AcrR family transcriptional regulator n=1 Tax=Nocardia jejuensis TaxID=328049 RepID=UPI0008359FC0|nr:TetR/AcrR family transcriptional regulator C-terminal domain-containing protein [Nocardia jejuensis]
MPTDHARSRRERPAKPALTRSGIIAAALDVMRADGLERVTMRRLAQELDTGPASLYVYVRNTGELHAAILDELLREVDLTPVTAAGAWQDRLVAVLTSYTTVLFGNPALARSALTARPSGPGYLNLVEAVLALLREGGVPDREAAWALDLLLQYATATAAEQTGHDADPAADADHHALAAALRDAPPRTHPHTAALASEMMSGSGEARLDWGFRLILNGALHTPRPDPLPGNHSH